MKKIFTTTVGLAALAIFVSSAQAFNLSSASVVNGLAAVSGGKAAVNANISWEGSVVTKANKNGGSLILLWGSAYGLRWFIE